MDKNDDVYAISGRIKNSIAVKNMGMSQAGGYLVNAYTLVLKEIHDFADKLPYPHKEELKNLLFSKESMPASVMQLSTPQPEHKTLYEELLEKEDAGYNIDGDLLKYYQDLYEQTGGDYGMSGDDYWLEAESSDQLTGGHKRIMKLARAIQMCKLVIEKEKSGK